PTTMRARGTQPPATTTRASAPRRAGEPSGRPRRLRPRPAGSRWSCGHTDQGLARHASHGHEVTDVLQGDLADPAHVEQVVDGRERAIPGSGIARLLGDG